MLLTSVVSGMAAGCGCGNALPLCLPAGPQGGTTPSHWPAPETDPGTVRDDPAWNREFFFVVGTKHVFETFFRGCVRTTT